MRVIYTLAITVLLIVPAYGQQPVKCRVSDRGNHTPNYNIGWNAYSVAGPRTLFLAIGIKPKHFNRNDMAALARQLDKVYCQEQRLFVTILDNRRAAREFSPTNENMWFQKHISGYYELDRSAGNESISFSLEPNKPDDEIKISLR